jgi:hypothetical protein
MLVGLALAAVACSLGGRVIGETGIAPPPETPTGPVRISLPASRN